MTASLLTYPHEVIRSRMMDARTVVTSNSSAAGAAAAAATAATSSSSSSTSPGFLSTCRTILVSEGWSGFYAGLSVSLLRTLPNTCITFISYELIVQWASKQHEKRI